VHLRRDDPLHLVPWRSLADGLHNEAIEELIEERRRQALLMIEKMKT
jgi:hypothetical protein